MSHLSSHPYFLCLDFDVDFGYIDENMNDEDVYLQKVL